MNPQNAETGTDIVAAIGPADKRCQKRINRAELYFKEDLRDQRGWYSKKAATN